MFFGTAPQHEVGHRRRDRRARRLAHPRRRRPGRRPRPLRRRHRRRPRPPQPRRRPPPARARRRPQRRALRRGAGGRPTPPARLDAALAQAPPRSSPTTGSSSSSPTSTAPTTPRCASSPASPAATTSSWPWSTTPRPTRSPSAAASSSATAACRSSSTSPTPASAATSPAVGGDRLDAAPRLAGAARRRHPAGQRRRADRARSSCASSAPPPRPERLMEPQPADSLVDLIDQLEDIVEPPPVSMLPADLGLGRPRRPRCSPLLALAVWRLACATAAPPPTAAPRSPSSRALAPALAAGDPGALARLRDPAPPHRARRLPARRGRDARPATPGLAFLARTGGDFGAARPRRSPPRPTARPPPSTAPPRSPPRAAGSRRHHA